MKVIKPITISSAMLVSSTAVEAYSAWSSVTAYALDSYVIRTTTNRVYRCIQGPSTNNTPETSPLWWTDVGPTNTWAMFDSQISTTTTNATNVTVVMDPGQINGLGLIGVVGGSVTVSATDGAGGASIYNKTISLDTTIITDWSMYFFEAFNLSGDVVLTDLPTYGSMRLTVAVTGTNVAIGNLSLGSAYDLGMTEYGATAGITDYSRKDTDAFGTTTFTRRGFSKRMSARSMIATDQMNKIQRILSDIRATPCVWIGTPDMTTYSPLVVYGFYRDFSIDIAYSTQCYCSLEVEGLT